MEPSEGNLASDSPLTKQRLSILQNIHTGFVGSLEILLRKHIPTASVSLLSLCEQPHRMVSIEESIPTFSSFKGFKSNERFLGEIAYSSELGHLIINLLLGIGEDAPEYKERPLSDLEQQMLQDVSEKLLDGYSKAWKQYLPIQFESSDIPTEATEGNYYVADYCIRTANENGIFRILLHLTPWLELLDQILPSQPERTPTKCNKVLLESLGACNVTAQAVLGSTRLTVRELLALSNGDIIKLEKDPSSPLEIRIGNKPKLLGNVHVTKGRFVITVASEDLQGGEG